jgi:hypothetical protein
LERTDRQRTRGKEEDKGQGQKDDNSKDMTQGLRLREHGTESRDHRAGRREHSREQRAERRE